MKGVLRPVVFTTVYRISNMRNKRPEIIVLQLEIKSMNSQWVDDLQTISPCRDREVSMFERESTCTIPKSLKLSYVQLVSTVYDGGKDWGGVTFHREVNILRLMKTVAI
jgi:hypothetical protein